MPDLPESNRRPPLENVLPVRAGAGPRYAELHCKTNFSFLEGASHPDELVVRAAELGCTALAITDRNSLAGVVRAHAAAKQVGLKLLIGAEIHLLDAPSVVLWATDRAAYGWLARLITCGRRRAAKGEFHLTLDDLAKHAEGLLAGVLPGSEGSEIGGQGAGAEEGREARGERRETGEQRRAAAVMPPLARPKSGLRLQDRKSVV